MARVPHASQIDLRFCNSAGQGIDFRGGARSSNFPRQSLNVLRQSGIK